MELTIPHWLKNRKLWIIALIILLIIWLVPKLFDHSKAAKATRVKLSKATSATISPHVEAVGSILARNKVDILSQVNGQLINVAVKDGQEVKKDDLLFEIDPKPFQADVEQAKANLARDQAAFVNANSEFSRYQKLVKQGYISKQLYDQVKSNADSAKATVKADQAALDNAQIQLSYTQIRAPISGRLSNINPKVGDLIAANGTVALTTINQFQPISAQFSIPAQNLNQIWDAYQHGTVQVVAIPNTDQGYKASGTLYFIDNHIDQTTGSIAMKASYPNADERLWPGEFVKIYLHLPAINNAVLIPTIAIQQDQNQQNYIYVVDQKNYAHFRKVVPGPTHKNMTSILSGLAVGELVVTRGQFEITDGSLVNPDKIS